MGKVTLSKKIVEGEKVTVEQNTYFVDRFSLEQLISIVREINKIMQDVKGMDGLSDTLDDVFGGGKLKKRVEQIKRLEGEDNLEELKKIMEDKKDQQFIETIANGFDYLAQNMPNRLVDLLAIASGVPEKEIQGAYADEVLDLFDEIIKENDIKKLWDRVKDSFFSTKDHWMSLVRKATK